MSLKDTLKGAKVLTYQRVSTTKQEGNLSTQERIVKDTLKNAGFTGKPEVFSEQSSGTKLDREELLKMIARALELKSQGKKVVIALRDIQRFSRDPYDLGILYKNTPSLEESLWFNDIPLVSLTENLVTGTKNIPNTNGDLIGPILMTIGGQEVKLRKDQTKKGVDKSAEAGIIAGVGINLYPKEVLNPYRELLRMLRAGLTQSEASRRLGRSKSWSKDNRKRLEAIALIGPTSLEDWLNVTDIIRRYEQEFGTRVGPSATKRMKAVGRKTSGYLKFPEKYPVPTEENIQFYFDNFKDFQPKRTS
jgi:DNA invertase Pin-like site-specific DNA recombinase